MAGKMTGGCQCGRIRYEAVIGDEPAYLCHCGMCRRATGGFAAAFVNLPKASVTWAREPDRYRSSAIAERGFCAACGTPLTFAFPDSDTTDLTIGSFDNPGAFVPHHHFSVETRLDGWLDTSGLPGYRLADHAPVADRWRKAVGKLPD